MGCQWLVRVAAPRLRHKSLSVLVMHRESALVCVATLINATDIVANTAANANTGVAVVVFVAVPPSSQWPPPS